jgi:hypothetical protein
MMVVHDLRVPLAVHHAIDVRRLRQRRHVEVAVVVVPGVLVVKHGNGHVAVLHVPVGHEVHAVRIHQHAQLNHIVQEALRFGVGAAHHLPDVLEELLRAEGFGRVQPAVDPHHRLAVPRQRARGLVGQAFGVGEPARYALVLRQLRVVRG